MEDESFLQLDAAFDEAFDDSTAEVPASSNLLQINKRDGARIQMRNREESESDSDSSSSDSDSEPEDHQNIQESEDDDDDDRSEKEIKDDNQM